VYVPVPIDVKPRVSCTAIDEADQSASLDLHYLWLDISNWVNRRRGQLPGKLAALLSDKRRL
jgi:hypothetical protein